MVILEFVDGITYHALKAKGGTDAIDFKLPPAAIGTMLPRRQGPATDITERRLYAGKSPPAISTEKGTLLPASNATRREEKFQQTSPNGPQMDINPHGSLSWLSPSQTPVRRSSCSPIPSPTSHYPGYPVPQRSTNHPLALSSALRSPAHHRLIYVQVTIPNLHIEATARIGAHPRFVVYGCPLATKVR